MTKYSIQPIQPYSSEDKTLVRSEILLRLINGVASTDITKIDAAAAAASQVSGAGVVAPPGGGAGAIDTVQFGKLSGLFAQLVSQGQLNAAQLESIITDWAKSAQGGPSQLSSKEITALKALFAQASGSDGTAQTRVKVSLAQAPLPSAVDEKVALKVTPMERKTIEFLKQLLPGTASSPTPVEASASAPLAKPSLANASLATASLVQSPLTSAVDEKTAPKVTPIERKTIEFLKQILPVTASSPASAVATPLSVGAEGKVLFSSHNAPVQPDEMNPSIRQFIQANIPPAEPANQMLMPLAKGWVNINVGNAETLASNLAGVFMGEQSQGPVARQILDLSFIKTTRQVATLLLNDDVVKTQPSSTSRITNIFPEAASATEAGLTLTRAKLDTLMHKIQDVAVHLETQGQANPLTRLGDFVDMLKGALTELNASRATAGKSSSLQQNPLQPNPLQPNPLQQSPLLKGIVERGFSFDLLFRPSVKVDMAVASLKTNGFDVLRIADSKSMTTQLRITVDGRGPFASAPIHLDLTTAEKTSLTRSADAKEPAASPVERPMGSMANATVHNHRAMGDSGDVVQWARIVQEASAAALVSPLADGLGVSAASDDDPIRQMGILPSMVSHQLDPILMGLVAFYEPPRPLDGPLMVDQAESFRQAIEPPLMLEYKPIEVISPSTAPGASDRASSGGFEGASDDVIDVENFSVS